MHEHWTGQRPKGSRGLGVRLRLRGMTRRVGTSGHPAWKTGERTRGAPLLDGRMHGLYCTLLTWTMFVRPRAGSGMPAVMTT